MNYTDIQNLEIKVRDFIQQQPGFEYFRNETLEALHDGPGLIGVVFGDNIQTGISGFGASVDEAFKDFVKDWDRHKGFKWIEKYKQTLNFFDEGNDTI